MRLTTTRVLTVSGLLILLATSVAAQDGDRARRNQEAERAVALSDMGDAGALDYARNRLDKIGVNRALRRAGLSEGDVVRIGNFAFDYEEDL